MLRMATAPTGTNKSGSGDSDKHGSLKQFAVLLPLWPVVRELDDDGDDEVAVDGVCDMIVPRVIDIF